jgi:hypothetical protein
MPLEGAPSMRSGASIERGGPRIMVFEGLELGTGVSLGDGFLYEPAANAWTRASSDDPAVRIGSLRVLARRALHRLGRPLGRRRDHWRCRIANSSARRRGRRSRTAVTVAVSTARALRVESGG